MARRYGLPSMLAILCLMLCVSSASAKWVKDGIPVCAENYNQDNARVIPDGANGTIVVWVDYRNGVDSDIYGNRIDFKGNLEGSGVPVCMAAGNQYGCEVILDGAGGVIIVWLDERDGNRRVFAQRVDTTGVAAWTSDGIDVCPAAVSVDQVRVISDGAGGAIIAWSDYRDGTYDVYAQRVDTDGNTLWDSDGLAVCSQQYDQQQSEMVADGFGGAILTWMDSRNANWDIAAQRIDGDGNLLWDPDAVPVCIEGNYQYAPKVAATSGGGAYFTWSDYRNGYGDVYAQLIDQDGLAVWTTDGIPVCPQSWNKYSPQVVEDGAGGAIIAWWDERSYYEVYAQRIAPDGNVAWSPDGIRVFSSYGDYDFRIVADGSGGAIVAMDIYYDEEAPSDIYAQRLSHSGDVLWGPKGSSVCTAENYQSRVALTPDGRGGAVIAWEDYRANGGNTDLYCQRVGSSGLWGNPEPKIVSCLDVPADQGGWVRIRTRASSLDAAGEYDTPIAGYNVWRMIAGSGGPKATSASTVKAPAGRRSELLDLLADPARATGVRIDAAEAALLGLPDGEWESVGFWFATRDTFYNTAVPTKNDSTEVGVPFEIFIVTAHASMAGVFAASEPDTGYSVDNLAPGMTGGLVAEQIAAPAGLRLSWDRNGASDMWKYNVHRGDRGTFVPDMSNLIGTTEGMELLDPSWASFYNYFYKLVAVDRHGNLSPAALLRPEDVKVGTMLQSFAASLKNAAVEIAWTLSEAGAGASFHVLRAADAGDFSELSGASIERDGLSFICIDRTCEPGTTYRYRVDVADEGGQWVLFETEAISTPSMALTLYQNHPNPFNPATVISFYVPGTTQVTLDIYDSSGKLVARLLDREEKPKGTHRAEWRGVDSRGGSVSSGVYFYRLQAGRETISKKMVLVR